MAQFTLVCCNSDMCKKCSMMDIVNLEHDQSEIMKVFRKNKIIWSPTSDQFWRSFPLKKMFGNFSLFLTFQISRISHNISPKSQQFLPLLFFQSGVADFTDLFLTKVSPKSSHRNLTEILTHSRKKNWTSIHAIAKSSLLVVGVEEI